MKYYKRSRFPRFIGSAGFVALLACALIAIGAAVWFAVSSRTATEQTPSGGNNTSSKTPSYDEPTPSYNSSAQEIPTPNDQNHTADVAGAASSVPYESEESASSESEPKERSFILPVDGNIAKGYSDTALQYSATYGDLRLHTGIDIACEKGTDVMSAGSGTVTAVEESSSLGKTVTVDHGDGIILKYCGLDSVNVKSGQTLSAGDALGTSGSVPCECADQSHIHIEATVDGATASPLAALGME